MSDPTTEPARWHTEPFDPGIDTAPEGDTKDCTGHDVHPGDHQEHDDG